MSPDIGIRIHSALVGGELLFEELHSNVALREGVFSIVIGTGIALTGTLDAETFSEMNRYLEVSVDGETLEPRIPFSSVAYALQSEVAEFARTTASDEDLETLQEQVDALLPSGAVLFFDATSCPQGWSVLESARGRVVAGVPSGGMLRGSVGSALSDRESRLHSHPVDPGGTTTSSVGAHSHAVDPPPASSDATFLSHAHEVDPPPEVAFALHNHEWAFLNGDGGVVRYEANGDAKLIFNWNNGINNEGAGVFPISVATNDEHLHTSNSSGRHEVDFGAFTSGSADTSHHHTLDQGPFASQEGGGHSHAVDLAATATASASNAMPYLQLLPCRKD